MGFSDVLDLVVRLQYIATKKCISGKILDLHWFAIRWDFQKNLLETIFKSNVIKHS